MDKAPNLWTLRALLKSTRECEACIGGEYVPARPIGFYALTFRVRLAWGVFTGRYDALEWPKGQ